MKATSKASSIPLISIVGKGCGDGQDAPDPRFARAAAAP